MIVINNYWYIPHTCTCTCSLLIYMYLYCNHIIVINNYWYIPHTCTCTRSLLTDISLLHSWSCIIVIAFSLNWEPDGWLSEGIFNDIHYLCPFPMHLPVNPTLHGRWPIYSIEGISSDTGFCNKWTDSYCMYMYMYNVHVQMYTQMYTQMYMYMYIFIYMYMYI